LILLHPPIAPWATADLAGLDLVLLTDQTLSPGRAFVRSLPDNEALLTPLLADGQDGDLQRWRAHIAWDGGNHLTRYAFVVARDESEGGHLWLGADGPQALVPPEALHFCVHPSERPPDWVCSQVFYQILPDRFARGANSTAVPNSSALKPWGAPIDKHHRQDTLYGGDLAGVLEGLAYLQEELGVTALYLTPVFASRSNHRYDTSDFSQVDALLGGNAALQTLREATAARGMRLVLDGVMNHTGADHAWLQTHPHFYARDDKGRPLGWKGHASLPVLDFAQAGVQDAMYAARDALHPAVLRRWLRPPHDIDGWRLDVIHMLGEGPGAHNNAQHVRAMRQAIREENPAAYVLGEHFSEATRWLQGEQEDGAMNYHGFATPVRAWLAGLPLGPKRARISTAQFEARLTQATAGLPYANQLAQLNLLGSHDTPRFLTELNGDLDLMRVALTLLFTRPGVPCVYYGDEIGLHGGDDPGCRGCFDWDRAHWQQALWRHCQALARLRQTRLEWQQGATLTLTQGDGHLVYARFIGRSAAGPGAATVVAVNRGPAVTVHVPLQGLPLEAAAWFGLGAEGAAVNMVMSQHSLRLDLPARGSLCVMSGAAPPARQTTSPPDHKGDLVTQNHASKSPPNNASQL
jgi:alpha-glucosidase